MVPTGQHPPRPGLGRPRARGQGDAGPWSTAADREAWFRSWSFSRGTAAALRSAVLRFAAMLDLGGRQDPPRFVPYSFSSMPTSKAHRRRERFWHANWYALELRSLVAQSSLPVSAMPRRVRPEPSSRRTRGVGTAGTTVAREQLDPPFMGPRPPNTQGTSEAVDSDRVSFLPYGPLVSDWLAFLAERLIAEFLRDVARGPRP